MRRIIGTLNLIIFNSFIYFLGKTNQKAFTMLNFFHSITAADIVEVVSSDNIDVDDSDNGKFIEKASAVAASSATLGSFSVLTVVLSLIFSPIGKVAPRCTLLLLARAGFRFPLVFNVGFLIADRILFCFTNRRVFVVLFVTVFDEVVFVSFLGDSGGFFECIV